MSERKRERDKTEKRMEIKKKEEGEVERKRGVEAGRQIARESNE